MVQAPLEIANTGSGRTSFGMILPTFVACLRRLGEFRGNAPMDARLHGIRGLAVLMVIASHSHVMGLAGQGGLGVWLFFVLSGFLLTQGFLDRPDLARSPAGVARFYVRRLKRLMPAYWIVVVLLFAPQMPDVRAFLAGNLLPLDGAMHLWSIKQEYLLYLLLPAIMLGAPLAQRHPLGFAAGVLMAGLLVHRFAGPTILTLRGNGEAMRFYAFPFFAGIAGAAFVRAPVWQTVIRARPTGVIADLAVAGFVGGVFLTANAWYGLPRDGREPLVWEFLVPSAGACMLVLLAALTGRGWLTGCIFGFAPLQFCGLCGYGLYLVHPWVIGQAWRLGVTRGPALFILCVLGSSCLAAPLYCLVERAFWRPRFSSAGGMSASTAMDTSPSNRRTYQESDAVQANVR